MTDILLATTNTFKIRKFREIFDAMNVVLRTIDQAPRNITVSENGKTFKENAEVKALEWSRVVDSFTVASDGGMRIPILRERWDAVRTGRFGGEGLSPRQRAERLLELMRPYRGEERRLFWNEAVAVARRGKLLASWETKGDEGILTDTLKLTDHPGNNWGDWWVGSLWYYPQFGKTYAELDGDDSLKVDLCWREIGRLMKAFFAEAK